MGALKDLYQSIDKELGGSQAFSHASEADFAKKLRRETIRHYISQELFDLELSLLLDDQQKGALFLSHREDKDAPLDELELIVRNKVSVNHYIGKAKKCILDLDELSTTDNEAETTELHRDEFSGKVLNMLQKQSNFQKQVQQIFLTMRNFSKNMQQKMLT